MVDPLTLQVLQRQQFAQKLSAHEFDAVMQPTLPRLLGLRMLNNVKIQYAQAENWSEVLDVLACQLLVETVDLQTQAALHFERGDCLQQMSMPSQAERAYKTCLEMSPSDEVLLQAQQRLRDLNSKTRFCIESVRGIRRICYNGFMIWLAHILIGVGQLQVYWIREARDSKLVRVNI